ncbi:glycosyltransferase family 1 protein [Paenibacillus cremeus]|uniref:Glycosyltransferase family 1 protein n=1 Tax=Paenibacillus cremeus TaxID=2163881 RepID=A0A559K0M6_9BACL|nr:glycosyltransferase family 1 protein [Paenibacillus cremeus]TVY05646.1 glycosyltransferase family 1 protein [Paenibacillus cremeus]
MEPVRILQVVTIMNRGGLETMLMNYYRQMDRSRIQFDFMVHRAEKGQYDDEISRLGGKIYRMPQIRPGNYGVYFKMLDEFFVNHPEYRLIHSHINENSSFVLRAAKQAGVHSRIAHSHTSNLGVDFKLPFRIYARLFMKNSASMYFACSESAGQWLFGKKLLNSGNVTILKNAINLDEFRYSSELRNEIRKKLNIVGGKLVVGHVGRFHKSKNHEFLIDIFKALNKKNPNSVLLLAGDGEERQYIEEKVSNLGLTSAVIFLGIRDDIARVMQAMDIFLFPSFFEGAPVVMIEAQATGLTCVVSDTITREIDLTGRVKYMSLKESPDVWADSILALPQEHEDTTDLLRQKGYDIVTTANSLGEFYLDNVL